MIRLPIHQRPGDLAAIPDEYLHGLEVTDNGKSKRSTVFIRLDKAIRFARNKQFKAFLQFLKGDNEYSMLINVLTGEIDALEDVISEVEARFGQSFFDNKKYQSKVLEIFDYKSLRSSQLVLAVFEKLSPTFCPYCNQNKLDFVTARGKRIALAQLDHFYSKERYPYLAASLFNLIPSCSPCNSQLKGTTEFDTLEYYYPHTDSLDLEFKFSLDGYIIKNFSDDGFTVHLDPNPDTWKPHNHDRVFHITERQQSLKSEILRLYQQISTLSSKAIRDDLELTRILDATITEEQMIERYINASIREHSILDRANGKLLKDMAISFGLSY